MRNAVIVLFERFHVRRDTTQDRPSAPTFPAPQLPLPDLSSSIGDCRGALTLFLPVNDTTAPVSLCFHQTAALLDVCVMIKI